MGDLRYGGSARTLIGHTLQRRLKLEIWIKKVVIECIISAHNTLEHELMGLVSLDISSRCCSVWHPSIRRNFNMEDCRN